VSYLRCSFTLQEELHFKFERNTFKQNVLLLDFCLTSLVSEATSEVKQKVAKGSNFYKQKQVN
jgi:hypothetical protein